VVWVQSPLPKHFHFQSTCLRSTEVMAGFSVEKAIFKLTLCPCFNTGLQNLSHENEVDLYEKEPVEETQFHMNGFVQRLVYY